MRYLTLGEVVALHRAIRAATAGAEGIRDLGALESALAQPRATFDGRGLYPTVVDKASALAYGLAPRALPCGRRAPGLMPRSAETRH